MTNARTGVLAGLAACLALIAAAPASAANLLLDSSFSDSTFPDVSAAWTIDDAYFDATGARGVHIQNSGFANNPGGDAVVDSGLWFRPWVPVTLDDDPGIGVDAAVSQIAAVIGGAAYTAEGAFNIEQNFTATSFTFELHYLDAAMTLISSAIFDLLAGLAHDGDWHDVSFGSVAPLNAAFAMVVVSMTGGEPSDLNPQSALADDLKLLGDAPAVSDVPLPAAFPLFLAGFAGLQLARRRTKRAADAQSQTRR